jgi:arylsulfatase A-like enzyme
MNPENVKVPPFFPDAPEVRNDILDYYYEIQRWDRELGEALAAIEKAGKLDNTLVVITSDNGMPFPRCKTNLYDYGTRMPLVAMWKARVKGGRVTDEFVNLADMAPTFLEAAGLKPGAAMTGRSVLPVLTGAKSSGRDHVVVGRERHTNRREGQVGYPMRAIRTRDWLYIHNYEPSRGPAGDPLVYGDIDDGPTKRYMVEHREDPKVKPLFDLACAKRPSEELYDLKKDPYQMSNVAGESSYAKPLGEMRARLKKELAATADPRETGGPAQWDSMPYYGGGPGPAKPKPRP